MLEAAFVYVACNARQVAVDFTGSNGNPMSPASLHYMNPMAPNQYQLAIQAVGGVLEVRH